MKAIASNITLNENGVVELSNKVVEISTYKDYYKHLECSTFDVARVEWLGEEISLYIDDEGLFKEGNLGREVKGYPQPLFGNIVICGGVDNKGNTLEVPDCITLENINDFIKEVTHIAR